MKPDENVLKGDAMNAKNDIEKLAEIPPPKPMDRHERMDRLHDRLVSEGLYVNAIPESGVFGWDFLIVAVDTPSYRYRY